MSWHGDRRDFLRMLATVGAGAAAGCNKPRPQRIQADYEPPEGPPPGIAKYYATTCRECPAGCGAWARTIEGRVLKLEGNPEHPINRGALCARGQAGVQALYNPDRVTKPLARGSDGTLREIAWDEALRRLTQAVEPPLAQGRKKAVAWLTGEISDSDADLVELLSSAAGMRKPVNLRLLPEAPLARAAERLFGYQGVPEFHLDRATLVVSLGADFMEWWGNPVEHIGGFTAMHAFRDGARGRVVYVGPRRSNTAAVCDSWLPLAPGREAAALRVLIEGMLTQTGKTAVPRAPGDADVASVRALVGAIPLAEAEQAVGPAAGALRKLGEDLAAAEAPLAIASGIGPDGELAQGLALLATHLGGGFGRTVAFPAPGRVARGNAVEDIQALFEESASGAVEVLLIQQANPAFVMPSAVPHLEKARFVACFATQLDETASRAHLILPIHHSLESWGDHAAAAGAVGLLQPAMRPLFGTREFADIVLAAAGSLRPHLENPLPWQTAIAYFDARLETYRRGLESRQPLDAFRREALRRGGIWKKTPDASVRLRADAKLPAAAKPETGLLAHFFPHPYYYDGRGADKPWLQEVPETSTAIVWGSWAEVHPDTARELNIRPNDALSLIRGDKEIAVPAYVTPQVMPGVVAVPIGQGHDRLGRYASGRGANPLRLADVSAARGNLPLAGFALSHRVRSGAGRLVRGTRGSENQEKRNLARAITLADAREGQARPLDEPTLYPEYRYPDHQWAMVIDMDACVGCGACVAACYAENNVAVVGAEEVARGRQMSWIRVEKYVEGDAVRLLLNLCQHCGFAPCEAVCPVHASYHTNEGLNAQVYNRCIGTRYCSNNCVYKVRRFNWFDYRRDPPLHLQYNPNVTVRERGMMEKCSFCIQRIREVRIKALDENRPIRDGEVVPACAQTCPAKAITFGDLKDGASRVTELSRDPRGYLLLGELGTKPSVVYLKKVVREGKV